MASFPRISGTATTGQYRPNTLCSIVEERRHSRVCTLREKSGDVHMHKLQAHAIRNNTATNFPRIFPKRRARATQQPDAASRLRYSVGTRVQGGTVTIQNRPCQKNWVPFLDRSRVRGSDKQISPVFFKCLSLVIVLALIRAAFALHRFHHLVPGPCVESSHRL